MGMKTNNKTVSLKAVQQVFLYHIQLELQRLYLHRKLEWRFQKYLEPRHVRSLSFVFMQDLARRSRSLALSCLDVQRLRVWNVLPVRISQVRLYRHKGQSISEEFRSLHIFVALRRDLITPPARRPQVRFHNRTGSLFSCIQLYHLSVVE